MDVLDTLILVSGEMMNQWLSYSWGGTPSPFVQPIVWGNVGGGGVLPSALANVAPDIAALKAVAPGRRGFILQHLGETVLNNPADAVGGFQGPWVDAGAAATAALALPYFQAIAAGGATIDYLVLDMEGCFNAWTLPADPVQQATVLAAISADPRYGTAVATGAAPALVNGLIPNTTAALSLFNQYCFNLLSAALQKAVVEPLLEVFPTADVSNFGYAATDGILGDGDTGFMQTLNPYPSFGTAQSPVIEGIGPNATTPYGSLVYGVNWLRMSSRLSVQPIVPWIGEPGLAPQWLPDVRYWREFLLHAMLCCGTRCLFFNPSNNAVDLASLQNAVQKLYNQSYGGSWAHTVIQTQEIPNPAYIASGAVFEGMAHNLTVYRLTFAPGVTSAVFHGRDVHPQPGPGGVGLWVVEH